MEASLIRNNTQFNYNLRERRAMGYGCWMKITNKAGKVIRIHEGFDHQIKKGLEVLKKRYHEWQPGTVVPVLSREKKIIPKNAASYSLYIYTPFFGEAIAFGHKTVGNRRFMNLWLILKPIWEKSK
jgi:hypothetical protein